MPTYSGPTPSTPTAAADAATWTNWWAYCTILQNSRYEDERTARAIVTDRQHTERMAAEAACAKATAELAAAQKEAARVMLIPTPLLKRSEESLVTSIAAALASSQLGLSDTAVIAKAQSISRKLVFLYSSQP